MLCRHIPDSSQGNETQQIWAMSESRLFKKMVCPLVPLRIRQYRPEGWAWVSELAREKSCLLTLIAHNYSLIEKNTSIVFETLYVHVDR